MTQRVSGKWLLALGVASALDSGSGSGRKRCGGGGRL
ncbi:Uncharacterised protein [Klebsiella michiganensis]|nr:Uncharacterised protein [Klebsiella michiganensis]